MRKHGFLVMNCCALLLLMAMCLPHSAYAEEELWWAISFEWEHVGGGKKLTYGAAWNFKTPEEAQIAAHKECRKKARNPRNCEQVGKMRVNRMKGECFVIFWSEYAGYTYQGIYNNEREKASARSPGTPGGLMSSNWKFEFMKCG